MELQKFAAIDIGTNAVRLLFTNVLIDKHDVSFKKSSLIRLPLRLGDDAFQYGRIGKQKMAQLMHTMIAFKHLLRVEDVVAYRACATSAMRESANSEDIIHLIRETTGINIEIITGKEEAEILYISHISDVIDRNRTYLYVDVGGGSTEITIFSKGKTIESYSFNIGTIRILRDMVAKEEFKYLKNWLEENINSKYENIEIVGSGGNINKFFKLSENKDNVPMTYKQLERLYEEVNLLSINERIKDLGFNPDRADVIVPAGDLFLKIMKWTGSKIVHVPRVGLADGIVRRLYFQLADKIKGQ
jgi:exopolyphosphatase / guanosine-5'-triphosphate,3'-diphosphate pyrophosphatase